MGNKKKFEVITISSDDEDVPLKVYRKPSYTKDTKATGLKTYNVQQCEFCDEAFFNRYDLLIHNTRHIIIPLMKHTVHQCTECLFYFMSPQELTLHKKLKHNLEEEPDVIVIDNEPENADWVNKYDMIKKKSNEKLKLKVKTKNNISSRLRFEDDVEEDVNEKSTKGLLNDLSTKVNMKIDAPSVETAGSSGKGTETDGSESSVVVIGDDGKGTDSEFTASTHFEELLRLGVYRCQRCSETFSTRYNLIQHDMAHMKIRKSRPLLCTFCERFISNNRNVLKHHLHKKHSATVKDQKMRHLQTCKKCGLKYYNYKRHMHNYHTLVYCHLCNEEFDNDEERLNHIRAHLVDTKCTHCDLVSTAIEIQEHQRVTHRVSYVSTIKICDVCSMFVKNKFNMQYVFLENVSEIGTRLQCERCFKMFFELKLVQRLHKKREKEHEGEKEKKKHLTNSDRLKNIQHRLKMFNKFSRY